MHKRLGLVLGLLLTVVASALAACNGGSSTGSPPVVPGIVITTPSPTPVPTTTPVNLIADGTFASGAFSAAGWTACSIPHPDGESATTPTPAATVAPVASGVIGAVIVSASSSPFPDPSTTPAIFTGSYAALTYDGTGAEFTYLSSTGGHTGPAGANGICQTFTVPANAELSMEVNEGSTESGLAYGDQEADVIPQSGASAGTAIPLFLELDNGQSYVLRGPYALTAAPYNLTAGQSVELFIGTFDKEPSSEYGEYMFVGAVNLSSSTSGSAIDRTTRSAVK